MPHARQSNNSEADASASVMMNATNIQCWQFQHSLTAGYKCLKRRKEGGDEEREGDCMRQWNSVDGMNVNSSTCKAMQ